jgi:molybdate transport system substrate-binding protein
MFERASGHKVSISFKGGPAITADVKQGAVDLVVTNAEIVDDLSKSGDVASGKTLLMISKIGLAVKAGAPRPDISTADKLKAALLAAKTVGYSQGTSGQHFLTVIERLGIADAVKAKAVIAQGEPVGAVIAKDAAEIGVQQVAELLPVPGIDFVGVLPGDLQKPIPYSAGIPAKAKDGATARALIDFLRSEPVLAVLKQKGMDLP